MAIASITQWLANPRDYKTGLLLYEQYGSNKVTLALLRNGSGNYHFQKLKAALSELNLNSSLEPKPIIFNEPAFVAAAQHNVKESPDFKDAPQQILELREQKNLKYAQARRLFEAIRVMDSAAHRLEAGLLLLDNMDFVNESWSVIDEWKENGRVREVQHTQMVKDVGQLSLSELLQESRNLPTYISKDRKKLNDAIKPTVKTRLAARIDERERRLKHIRERLDNAV